MNKVKLPSQDVVKKKKKEIPFLSYNDMEKIYNESNRIQERGYKINGDVGDLVYGNNAKIIKQLLFSSPMIFPLYQFLYLFVNCIVAHLAIKVNVEIEIF